MASRSAKRNLKQVRLNRTMDRRLKDYSLAAAGVGALALAAPAHAAITSSGPNLNFSIPADSSKFVPVPGYPDAVLIVNFVPGGSVRGYGVNIESRHSSGANASFFGKQRVEGGPNQDANVKRANLNRLVSKKGKVSGDPIARASSHQIVPSSLTDFGRSTNLVLSGGSGSNFAFKGSNEYLGFSVTKGGVTHYGWINLAIAQPPAGPFSVTVNEIAIENCPAAPITIGQASGGASCGVPTTPAPNSLWLLSLGVAGLAGLEALRRLRKTA